jgi:hypothetical protein
MTDNIRNIGTAKPAGKAKSMRSVTIMSGNNFGLQFTGNTAKLSISPQQIEEIAKAHQARFGAATSAQARHQDARTTLISLLQLDEGTIARIDTNAKILGLSFEACISAEISS